MLNGDVEIRRKGEHGFTAVIEGKNCEMDREFLPTEKCNRDGMIKNKLGPSSDLEVEDSINGSINVIGDTFSPCFIPISEKETVFYSDKTVTEIGMPKLTVCFEEHGLHVVKDICVDEGKPPPVKIIVENEVDCKRCMPFTHFGVEYKSCLINGVDSVVNGQDGFKSLPSDGNHISGENKEVSNKCSSPGKLVEDRGGLDAIDKTVNDTFYKKVLSEKMPLGGESDEVNRNTHSSNFDRKGEQQQSNQGNNKEVISEPFGVSSVAEESNTCNNAKNLSVTSEMEDQRTFNFDSSPSGENGTGETIESAYERTLNLFSEHGLLDGPTTSNQRSLINHGQARSSLSGTVSLSGRHLYSGSTQYSGSISLRSESSTASTRSFAFPILHSDWPDSPIKMAKADRSNFRKRRGWKLALLCCRF